MGSIKEVYKAVTGSHKSENKNVINIVCQSSDSMIITLAENQVIEKPAQAQLWFFYIFAGELVHLVKSRTRKLSSWAPMVLGVQHSLRSRVGRGQKTFSFISLFPHCEHQRAPSGERQSAKLIVPAFSVRSLPVGPAQTGVCFNGQARGPAPTALLVIRSA